MKLYKCDLYKISQKKPKNLWIFEVLKTVSSPGVYVKTNYSLSAIIIDNLID